MGETASITALDGSGSFDAYVARPTGTARAAIIVIQEIFGINPGIRTKCDLLAADGYLAYAPDLFWRIEPHIELDPDIPEELQTAFRLFGKFDQDKGIADLEATIKAARTALGESGKVGLVGYCLGGRLAFMSACRTDGDAFVGYYGVGIDGLLSEQHAIGKPVLLHIPTADHLVPPDAQKAMHDGLAGNRHVTLLDYDGLDHGFAAQMGLRRDEDGAVLADGRTAAFFAENL
ncbi:MAG: carboxymethylenebutenolidase [Sphingobium sp.]|nr:MAG: carboxymethylenebutenolidase [Sphingobium sp.]